MNWGSAPFFRARSKRAFVHGRSETVRDLPHVGRQSRTQNRLFAQILSRILLEFPLLDEARPLSLLPLLALVIRARIASSNIAIPRGMMGPRPLSCHVTGGHRAKS